ncbi:ComEA family DNA-binding protein [Shewanella avicenniae]|nr:helix-hairpin-helix domain-containing protein [Shewanella avicenniae]
MKIAKLGLFAAALVFTPVSYSLLANEAPTPAAEVAPAASAPQELQTISINTASVAELQLIKGVGKAKAEAIIEYRETHGKFESIEQLANVKGIGKKLIEKNAAILSL